MLNFFKGLFRNENETRTSYTIGGVPWVLTDSAVGLNSRGNLTRTPLGVAYAYIFVPELFAAVNVLAENAALVPLQVVDADGNPVGTDSEGQAPPAVAAVGRSWQYGQVDLFQQLTASLVLWGEAYAEIVRNHFGYITGYKPLLRVNLTPQIVGGEIVGYMHTEASGSTRLDARDVLRVRLWNPLDDNDGYSPAYAALGKAQVRIEFDTYTLAFYDNRGVPGVFAFPREGVNMSKQHALEISDLWKRQFRGATNFFKAHVSHFPLDLTTLDTPDIEKPLQVNIESKRDLRATLRVPPEMVGDTADNPYQFSPEKRYAFMTTAVRPYVEQIVKGLNHTRDRYGSEYNTLGHKLQADFSAFDTTTDADMKQVEVLRMKYESGGLTYHQYREALGENIPEGVDDFILLPIDKLIKPLDGGPAQPPPAGAAQTGDTPPETDSPTEAPTPPGETRHSAPDTVPAPFNNRDVPQKYSDIDFTPPEGVRDAARRGVELTEEGYGGDGLEDVTVKEARAMARGENVTVAKAQKGFEWWARNERFLEADDKTSPAWVAAMLWGGRPGRTWFGKLGEQMNEADEEEARAIVARRYDNQWGEVQAFASFVRARAGKANPRPFTFEHLEPDHADRLHASAAQHLRAGNADAIMAVVDEIRDSLNTRAIQATRVDFENEFGNLLARARSGDLAVAIFEQRVQTLIGIFARRAYRDGLADGGVDPDEMTSTDETRLQSIISNQLFRVRNLAARLRDDAVTDAQAARKPIMWFNKSIYPAYTQGVLSADRNGMVEWVLGLTEEHCRTCLAANGQRHRRATFEKYGVIPKRDNLECKGFNCDCALVPTSGRARGSLQTVPLF